MGWGIGFYPDVSFVEEFETLKTGILKARIARASTQAQSFSNLLARYRPILVFRFQNNPEG
jgi:hypothetical protein